MAFDAAPLAAFAFATSITPGPNNLMLMSSGARFGLRRTTPHLLGVTLGFGLLALCVALGLAQIFNAFPMAEIVMKGLSAAFILYLASKIAQSGGGEEAESKERPLSFAGALLFQWINPKCWAMALTAMTVYAPTEGEIVPIVGAISLFCMVNLPCCWTWAAAGAPIFRWLKRPGQRRAFNVTMATLLVISMVPMIS